ncbi:MAG: multifunctional CCA addition/repair protein [Gammaproteobacteria bacterium]
MQTYLVGGAVRDRLLGETAAERDWVVVGATPAELETAGYRRVGRSFPVFLHPDTGEEYALARTERKTGPGYTGFDVCADPTVTLEEDLQRRDLTINAIAQAKDGSLIDPYGGQRDIADRVLRHVSDAFREDPVRILRLARFAARFRPFNFRVADETQALLKAMVAAGETSALVPERVWKETDRALGSDHPEVFFEVLRDCGALAVLYPELDNLYGVPQPPRHHPEVDTGVHVMLALQQAARLGASREVRFAVLMHDLGKGTTAQTDWPSHPDHERRSLELVRLVSKRLGVPRRYRELAEHVALYHTLCHRAEELRPTTILKLLEGVDALRRPEMFDEFLLACEADARGRTGFEERAYPQAERLRRARAAAAAVRVEHLPNPNLQGPAVGEALRQARCAAIARLGD